MNTTAIRHQVATNSLVEKVKVATSLAKKLDRPLTGS